MQKSARKKLNLSTQIIIGLLLGALTGVFLGELAAPFDYIGQAFIGLLQMTVLPYIVFSLIANIGKLSLETGKQLVIIGLKVLVVLLAFGMITLLVVPLSLPVWHTGSFFSPSFNQPVEQVDLISLYIPSNPFWALSSSQVPAVVLFSIILGLGLMKVPNKDGLINALDVINNALNQVNKLIIKLTPIGVFAIAAATVGTVSWQHLGKLQAFLMIYTGLVLIIVFWILPGAISAVTPFTYRDVFKYSRATLLTIFATGKIIVVLPQLIDNIDEMFDSRSLKTKESESATDILMPLAYPFPNLGSFLIMFFVPFAAWYAGSAIPWSEMPVFLVASLLSSFIAPVTGIPFMLNLMDISKDMFQLFFVSTVYTDRIRVLLGAMHLIALTVISVSIYLGYFKINYKKLVNWAIISVVLLAGLVLGMNRYLNYQLKDAYQYDKLVYEIPERFDHKVEYKVLDKATPNPVKIKGWQSRMSRIRSRGVIRVGFISNYLPFSYVNSNGDLTGFDVEMAKLLAESLSVQIEFVPVEFGRLNHHLNRDHIDILMAGVPLSSNLAEDHELSHSYIDINLAFLAGSRSGDFINYATASDLDTMLVAYSNGTLPYVDIIKPYFPGMANVEIDSFREFIAGDTLVADALLVTAESGAYQSLLNPKFSVVNPFPEPMTLPLVYVVGFESLEFISYLNNWIIVASKQGYIDKLYDHWILGKQITQDKPNWSIIKDVLHWVD